MTIKELLDIQAQVLYDIGLNNEFNFRITFEVDKRADYLSKDPALNLIQYNLFKIIILELSKLYNHSEDFSLYKLFSFPKDNDNTLKKDLKLEDLKKHRDSFKNL